jgi:GGDEF domain-containing protein
LELSAGLLEHWKLPTAIVRAVAHGHSGEGFGALLREEQTLATVVRLADLVTSLVVDERAASLERLLALGRQIGWSAEQITRLVATLEEKVSQLARVLALSLPNGVSYSDVLAAAQRQLSSAAAEAVPDVVRSQRARAAADEGRGRLDETTATGDSEDGELNEVWQQTQQLGEAVAGFLHGRTPPRAKVQSGPTMEPTVSGATPAGRDARTRALAAPTIASEPALEGRLAVAVAACRAARQPLSLLLVAIDHYAEATFALGPSGMTAACKLVSTACRQLDGADCHPAGDGVWAVVLLDSDRDAAVTQASSLVSNVRRTTAAPVAKVSGPKAGEAAPLSVSVGVATVALPPRNFPVATLIEKASRCLYAAHAAGGNGQKSIEIY